MQASEVIEHVRSSTDKRANIETLTKALEGACEKDQALLFMERGEVHLELGKYDAAIDDCLLALQHGSKDKKRAYTICGKAMQGKNLLLEARKYFAMLIETDGKSADAYVLRGYMNYLLNKDDEALADFNKAIELDVKCEDAYYNRGLLHSVRNEWNEALSDFSKVADSEKWKKDALYQRGVAYLRLGKMDEMKVDLKKAAELGNTFAGKTLANVGAISTAHEYVMMGRYHRDRAEDAESAKAFEKALELGISDEEEKRTTLLDLGNAYNFMRKYDESIKYFSDAIKSRPDANAHMLRGRAYYNAMKDADARKDYDKALELDPSLALAYRFRGELNITAKAYEDAMKDFTRSIELSPYDDVAFFYRAHTYIGLKKMDDAKSDFLASENLGNAKAIEDRRNIFGPETANDYYDLGTRTMNLGDYMGAKPLVEKALEMFKKQTKVKNDYAFRHMIYCYSNKGMCESVLGELDEAMADLEYAVNENPEHKDALINLGNVYQKKGMVEKALEIHTRAIELDKTNISAYYNRGRMYLNMKKFDEAIKDFTVSVEGYQDAVMRADAFYNRSKAYKGKGMLQEALDDMRQAATLAFPQCFADVEILEKELADSKKAKGAKKGMDDEDNCKNEEKNIKANSKPAKPKAKRKKGKE